MRSIAVRNRVYISLALGLCLTVGAISLVVVAECPRNPVIINVTQTQNTGGQMAPAAENDNSGDERPG